MEKNNNMLNIIAVIIIAIIFFIIGYVVKQKEINNDKYIINKPDTVRLTCADIVNRIPDVINAKAGFLSTSKLKDPTYKQQYE